MKVVVQMKWLGSHCSNFDVELGSLPPTQTVHQVALAGPDRLSYLDGTPAETLDEVIATGGVASAPGVYQRRVEFSDERLIPTVGGETVAIRALSGSRPRRRLSSRS